MRRIPLAVALILGVAGASRVAAQTPVTTCGQEIRGSGILTTDLDCTGSTAEAAVIIERGKLLLNGFTIKGGIIGVDCDGPCKIIGPGTITGSETVGVNGYGSTVRIERVDITDHPLYGASCIDSCQIKGPMTMSGNAIALRIATNANLRAVTLVGNGYGLLVADIYDTGKAIVRDSMISGNTIGISAQRSAIVMNSTVTGNTRFGVAVGDYAGCLPKGTATLKNSSVTGNGTDAGCGVTMACADVAACSVAPRLGGSATCDHSYQLESDVPGNDWDVCALD